MNVETLLAPLDTGEQGAGLDLRGDFSTTSAYQRLRDARTAARAEERARDADDDAEAPDAAGWREVLAVGEQALATQTKDIEIAAWMTEALVRRDGLQGLTEGARLIAGLCDAFWDALFPLPDEDGLDAPSSPIEGLSGGNADGTVMQPLRRLSLFRRADGRGIGLYQWEQAEKVSAMEEERRNARYAAGAPELSTLVAEARLDRAYLIDRGREVVAAADAWRALDEVLNNRFESAAPSLRKVRALLDRMLQVVTQLGGVPAVHDAAPAAPPAGPTALTATVASAGAAAPIAGALTRESALLELDRIADFFRRTEPHSPLAYTLEEAVRRGRMSLAELLAEVLPDTEVRNGMLARLGMRSEQS